MPDALKNLFDDLDLDGLRVSRPTKFIFLCGGKIGENPKVPVSLRHYLLLERKIEPRIKAQVILADKANQLYRDTAYKDLISFEEDIALISASVMVITESAGSLAELGAFTANQVTRPHVSIISQTEFSQTESFVRYGPIERVKRDDEERVAFIPWRINGKGLVIKSSVSGHVGNIVSFVNDTVAKVAAEELYSHVKPMHKFINILWLLHNCTAMSVMQIQSYKKTIFGSDLTINEIKNILYCMKFAGWVDSYEYLNKTYWYTIYGDDPFSKYKYRQGVQEVNTILRKIDVAKQVKNDLGHPAHVVQHVSASKLKPNVIA
ncbi:retron St85 family effector protein [Devosia sp. Naph2]|uniref:retron St85 family effector protein n=1 Tax=Devosia polycyclovorans TaxID=3345148 RepID=UPI0035CF7966